ncbi:hypothetical protein ACOSP7_028523 [Xanthoceras sorbifolium]
MVVVGKRIGLPMCLDELVGYHECFECSHLFIKLSSLVSMCLRKSPSIVVAHGGGGCSPATSSHTAPTTSLFIRARTRLSKSYTNSCGSFRLEANSLERDTTYFYASDGHDLLFGDVANIDGEVVADAVQCIC